MRGGVRPIGGGYDPNPKVEGPNPRQGSRQWAGPVQPVWPTVSSTMATCLDTVTDPAQE